MEMMNIPQKYNSLQHAIKLIHEQEGFRGYFRGYSASALLIPLNYLIYFDLYERLKLATSQRLGSKHNFLCFAIPSTISGLVTSLILCPLWVTDWLNQSMLGLEDKETSRYLQKSE